MHWSLQKDPFHTCLCRDRWRQLLTELDISTSPCIHDAAVLANVDVLQHLAFKCFWHLYIVDPQQRISLKPAFPMQFGNCRTAGLHPKEGCIFEDTAASRDASDPRVTHPHSLAGPAAADAEASMAAASFAPSVLPTKIEPACLDDPTSSVLAQTPSLENPSTSPTTSGYVPASQFWQMCSSLHAGGKKRAHSSLGGLGAAKSDRFVLAQLLHKQSTSLIVTCLSRTLPSMHVALTCLKTTVPVPAKMFLNTKLGTSYQWQTQCEAHSYASS